MTTTEIPSAGRSAPDLDRLVPRCARAAIEIV